MAIRLPTVEDIQQVGAARDPGVRAQPDDFGAQIGRAMQQAGQAIQNVSEIGLQLAKKRQEAEDKVFLDTYDLEHARQSNETFLNAQSEAPLGGEGFTNTVDTKLAETGETLAERLIGERGFRPSEKAMQAAQSIAINRRAGVLVKAQTWEHNKRVEALATQFDENIDALAQTAFSSGDVEESLARLYDSAKAYQGIIPADALDQKIDTAEETIVRTAIEGLLLADRNDEAEALTEKYFGKRPRPESKPLPADTAGRANMALSRLMSAHGLTKEQAAGIVGNLVQESNVRPDGPSGDQGTAHGMAQWRGERFNRLKRFAAAQGKDWTDFDAQVDFIVVEMKTQEADAWQALQNAQTVEQATAAFIGYERPAGWSRGNPRGGHGWDNRLSAALAVAGSEAKAFADGEPPMMPNAQVALASYKAIDTNRRAEAAVLKADLERTAIDAVAATTHTGGYDGALPTEQEFISAYGDDGQRRYRQFQTALDTGRTMNDMRTMSMTEIVETVQASAPAGAGEGFAGAQERYDTIRKAAENVIKERNDNPASYVATHYPPVARMWEQAEDGASMQRAARASLDIQNDLGIPKENRRILSNSQVATIALEFQDRKDGGQNAAQFMQGLQEQWGDLWPQVFGELSAELPATVMVVGSMGRVDQARAAEELAEAIKQGRESYEKLIPEADRSGIRDGVLEQLPEFAETVLPISGGESTINAVRESVELLAMRYVTRGDAPKRAVKRAYNDIIGKAYEFQGTYRIPKKVAEEVAEPRAIRVGARASLANIGDLDVDLPVSVQGLDEKEARDAYLSAVRSRGFWVTAHDESGLVLYDEQQTAVTVDGNPVLITWDELAERARREFERPIAPGMDPLQVSP